MKKLIFLTVLLALVGCKGGALYGDTMYDSTSPGHALPEQRFGQWCNSLDEIGRCTDWKYKQDMCVNPLGISASPGVVPCASIKRQAGEDAK